MRRVIHFEIQAEDPERAVKFYSSVFGWEFSKWAGPIDYWLISTGADAAPGINGGLLRRKGPPPGEGQAVNAFVCTIDVASLDEHVGKITGAGGGIVLPKMAVPGVGWLAYAKDTEGNIFGIMEADGEAA